MAAAFPRRKLTTPSPSACWACANARRWSAAKSACAANLARARRSPCAFPSPGKPQGRADLIVMKILITDDHAVVRQGLKLILADQFKRAEFGEARNAHEALNR